MIDVHSHILYGLDDGAQLIDQSINMAKQMEELGYTDICCTSHVFKSELNLPNMKTYKENLESLKDILKEKNISLNIHMGNEIHIRENVVEYVKGKKVNTLANSRYILLELPMSSIVSYLENVVYELRKLGKIVIIAHPERYLYVQENPNILIDYINQGVIFQSNLGSLIGKFGKKAQKTVKILLKNNMVQVMATDSHTDIKLFENTKKELIQLEKIVGEKRKIELLEINPYKIINDETFTYSVPTCYKKFF